MNRFRLLFFVIVLMPSAFLFAQKKAKKQLEKENKVILANLESHIYFLADDKLEGRRAGTKGEELAMNYIAEKFKEAGLEPKGTDGYYQAFPINDGKQVGEKSHLSINGNELKLNDDYFPFVYCPNINLEALPAASVKETDMPWFIDLKEVMEDNANNPHFDLKTFVHDQAAALKKKGATALFYYNSGTKDDELKFDGKDKSETTPIPVLYLTKNVSKKYLADPSAVLDVKMKINITDKKRTGHNVVGYINNGAANTVILGAHFDHLGYGEDGNSMIRTGEKLIHNGADDNASGTAALIELSKLVKQSAYKNNNYLILAFSGEELGLFGSKYFVDNPTIDLSKATYMINMDMVGRLNDSTHVLTVGGYGTSPEWGSVIPTDEKRTTPFIIKIDSSGSGPSDHTSFYRKDIPVLFFFTGLHKDYHKPTDDADKINYNGELSIVRYIYGIIQKENSNTNKLTFTKTRETQTTTSARFSVSMGIMPDYTYAGTGVRADGVSDGKPAQKAGLQAGDIIIQLGDYPTPSLESYMQALGKFKKGDQAKVKYKRGNNTAETSVQF